MFNCDEIFFRLGVEKSEELLEMIQNVENPNFQDDKGIFAISSIIGYNIYTTKFV
jgi:hypothetical protein